MVDELKASKLKIQSTENSGVYGTVVCAPPYATKTIQKWAGEYFASSSLREVAFLSQFGGQYAVPRLHEFKEFDGKYMLKMDDAGVTFYELARKLFYNERIRLFDEVFLPIVQTLAFMHTNGIIHGDIKPKNIMRHITNKKSHLIDYGSIIIATGGKYVAGGCTYAYQSPEAFQGTWTPAIDVWGLALCMVDWICKDTPTYYLKNSWDKDDIKSGLSDIKDEHFPLPYKIKEGPPRWKMIISMLTMDHTKRPEMKDILLQMDAKSEPFASVSITKKPREHNVAASIINPYFTDKLEAARALDIYDLFMEKHPEHYIYGAIAAIMATDQLYFGMVFDVNSASGYEKEKLLQIYDLLVHDLRGKLIII